MLLLHQSAFILPSYFFFLLQLFSSGSGFFGYLSAINNQKTRRFASFFCSFAYKQKNKKKRKTKEKKNYSLWLWERPSLLFLIFLVYHTICKKKRRREGEFVFLLLYLSKRKTNNRKLFFLRLFFFSFAKTCN